MILSEVVVEERKQCGIPIDETPTVTVICPEEAIGEIAIPLEDGMTVDMPICQGHLSDIERDWKRKLDNK